MMFFCSFFFIEESSQRSLGPRYKHYYTTGLRLLILHRDQKNNCFELVVRDSPSSPSYVPVRAVIMIACDASPCNEREDVFMRTMWP